MWDLLCGMTRNQVVHSLAPQLLRVLTMYKNYYLANTILNLIDKVMLPEKER